MLNVIICEDNPTIIATHQLIVKNYVKEHPKLAVHIDLVTTRPTTVESYLAFHSEQPSLYVLATSFPDSKTRGLQLARLIHRRNYRAQIIFISDQPELKSTAYRQAGAWLDFIDKNASPLVIQARLHQVLHCLTTCGPPCERLALLTS